MPAYAQHECVQKARWRCAMLQRLVTCACVLLAAGCATPGTSPSMQTRNELDAAQFAKTDLDRVAEAHQREIFVSLKLLTEKLYRRNPREWRKGGHGSLDEALARIYSVGHAWNFPELGGKRSADALRLAFQEDYTGDRVLALSVGLGSMIQSAFHDKSEFFILDDLEPQALYNAARNVEIAVWKLSNTRVVSGELLLLSNDSAGPAPNLSFEREFGKIISSLDVLSSITADKNNRTIVRMVQGFATAIFLPLK